jgi:hypothetical protein
MATREVDKLLFKAIGVISADQSPCGLNNERTSPARTWDLGLESHSRHRCLCSFILCSCCSVCIGSGLAID